MLYVFAIEFPCQITSTYLKYDYRNIPLFPPQKLLFSPTRNFRVWLTVTFHRKKWGKRLIWTVSNAVMQQCSSNEKQILHPESHRLVLIIISAFGFPIILQMYRYLRSRMWVDCKSGNLHSALCTVHTAQPPKSHFSSQSKLIKATRIMWHKSISKCNSDVRQSRNYITICTIHEKGPRELFSQRWYVWIGMDSWSKNCW